MLIRTENHTGVISQPHAEENPSPSPWMANSVRFKNRRGVFESKKTITEKHIVGNWLYMHAPFDYTNYNQNGSKISGPFAGL